MTLKDSRDNPFNHRSFVVSDGGTLPSYCGKALVGPFVKQITEELLKLVALTVLVDGMTSKQATILSHGKAVRTRKLKKADYVNKYQMRVRSDIGT